MFQNFAIREFFSKKRVSRVLNFAIASFWKFSRVLNFAIHLIGYFQKVGIKKENDGFRLKHNALGVNIPKIVTKLATKMVTLENFIVFHF